MKKNNVIRYHAHRLLCKDGCLCYSVSSCSKGAQRYPTDKSLSRQRISVNKNVVRGPPDRQLSRKWRYSPFELPGPNVIYCLQVNYLQQLKYRLHRYLNFSVFRLYQTAIENEIHLGAKLNFNVLRYLLLYWLFIILFLFITPALAENPK